MTKRMWERAELALELAHLRTRDPRPRIVLANGCFDVVHVGHVRYLEDARARGDYLVVALNTDESVRALKGPGRPMVPLAERAEILLAFACVDAVTAFGERDLEATLRALLPDVHAKGSDYTIESVPEAAIDRELGIRIAICGDAKARSSTEMLARIAKSAAESARA